jgi:hypothetical protein
MAAIGLYSRIVIYIVISGAAGSPWLDAPPTMKITMEEDGCYHSHVHAS